MHRALDYLRQGAAQFSGDMHRRGGDEGVDTIGLRHAQRFISGVDIFLDAARQPADAAVFNGARDGLNGFKVARRRDRKTDFHHVDAHALQRQCDLQFFFHTQAGL